MILRSLTGTNTAERAPMITSVLPAAASLHIEALWDPVSLLWMTATLSPNLLLNRAVVWGTRDISGISTIAPPPAARASSMHLR